MEIELWINRYIQEQIKEKNIIRIHNIKDKIFTEQNIFLDLSIIKDILDNKEELLLLIEKNYIPRKFLYEIIDNLKAKNYLNVNNLKNKLEEDFYIELEKEDVEKLINSLKMENNNYYISEESLTFEQIKQMGLKNGTIDGRLLEKIDYEKEKDVYDKWEAREEIEGLKIKIY